MCATDLAAANGSIGLLLSEIRGYLAVFLWRRLGRSSSKFNRAGCLCFSLGCKVNGQRIDVSSYHLFWALVFNNWCGSTRLLVSEAFPMHAVKVFSSRIQSSWVCELGHRYRSDGHVFNYLLLLRWNVIIIFSSHQRRQLLKLSHLKSMVIRIPSVIKSENTDAGVLRACLQRHFSGENSHVAIHNTQVFDWVSGRATGRDSLRRKLILCTVALNEKTKMIRMVKEL